MTETAAQRVSVDGKSNSVTLDPRVEISGILRFDGDLHISGNYRADFQCEKLFVQSPAVVDGVIVAGMVEVEGELHGEVYADLIILRATAHVEAELTFRAIEVDSGSFFEGRSRRVANPMSLAPSFDDDPD